MLRSYLVSILIAACAASAHLDIMHDCGAVPKTSLNVAYNDTVTNAKALLNCLNKANETAGTVVVPKGWAFSSMGVNAQHLVGVTLQIDGVWEAAPFYDQWPSK